MFFKKILGFINLYRLDIAFITVLLYLFGSFFVIGFKSFNVINFLMSFLISFVSVNFIYSLNSWFDADIDKINKPTRPIPAGIITKKEAYIYSICLLLVSIVYPIFFINISNFILLVYIFPIIGILYSNKIFSFKKNKYLALFAITFSLVMVFAISFLINGGIINNNFILTTISFWFLTIAIVIFKDLSDIEGDKKYGSENWFVVLSKNKVLAISFIFILLSFIFSFFMDNIFIKIITIIQLSSILFLLFIFSIFKINFDKFYNSLLKFLIINGFIYIIIYSCVKLFL